MVMSTLRLLLVVLAIHFPSPRFSAEPAPASSSVLTPEQAQRALDLLQNDQKRGELITTLQAIVKAAPPPSQLPPDSLGAQLLVQVSGWLRATSDQLE